MIMIMKCIKLCQIEGSALIYHISVDVKGSEIIPVLMYTCLIINNQCFAFEHEFQSQNKIT